MASVAGAGFVTLAATLSSTGALPVAGLALLLGVDRFMSESRAVTNLIGNGVAGLVISKWEGALDEERMRRVLANESDAEADSPEEVLDWTPAQRVPAGVGSSHNARLEQQPMVAHNGHR